MSKTASPQNIAYSGKLGEEAADLILQNNLHTAVEYISLAIVYNPIDHRHYLNRSFCYLRLGENNLAFDDARTVIQGNKNLNFMFVAKLRAGQALFGLQRYGEAEKYIKQAADIKPSNVHVKRELLRVRVTYLVASYGYSERDALLALEQFPCVSKAINYLSDRQVKRCVTNSQNYLELFELDDEAVYVSDDYEAFSNIKIANRILNYQPGNSKLQHIMAYCTESTEKDDLLKENGLPALKVNDKAVWVGNLTDEMSDDMLKSAFSQFGNIISVYRPFNTAFAFINFENSEDAKKAISKRYIQVYGISVKVWFQNRRTKHKRMQQEEEAKTQQQSSGGGGSNSDNSSSNNNTNKHHVSKWQQETGDYHHDEDDDEMIDPEADDCSSGSEA